jgi:hypothetical protein
MAAMEIRTKLRAEWLVPLIISLAGAGVSGYVGYQHTKERVAIVETVQTHDQKDILDNQRYIEKVETAVIDLHKTVDDKTGQLDRKIDDVRHDISDVKDILLEDRRYTRGQ